MVSVESQQNFKTRNLRHLRRPQVSSRFPEGEETLRPPQSGLRRPSTLQMGIQQKVRERMTWGDQSFQELICPFIFQVRFYTLSYT